MIYSKVTKKAMIIAYNAHMGQVDRGGIPYVFHPIHLAEQMDNETECVVALLHDAVEDSDITFEQLGKEFSNDAIDALKLLTHDKAEDYMEYIQKIKSNKIARKVKIADLKHNIDADRLDKVKDADILRIREYKRALDFLEQIEQMEKINI